MPTTSIRASTAVRIVTLLTAEPSMAGATVTFGHPGEQLVGDTFVAVVLSPEGRTERANFKGGRHQRDDRYTCEVHVAVFGTDLSDFGEAISQTCEDLAGVVDGLIATNPTLAIDGNGLSGLVSAATTAVNGPNLYRLADGYAAEAQVDVACHARLT